MTTTNEKHVMLSYNHKSKDVVRKINDILKAAGIQTWMDEDGGMKDDIYESMAVGVENAYSVCCFMTVAYQESVNCKLELEYAQKRGKQIIPCMLAKKTDTFPSSWLGIITAGLNYINLRDTSDENISKQADELINRINQQPSESVLSTNNEPMYLIELIKYNYLKNNRIERLVNSSKSFPIEESYINLSLVDTQEQQQKERKLRSAQANNVIISTFEEIYGTKTAIDVKRILQISQNKIKQVLVLGRAGIGKSTFLRYVAYQWAYGSMWHEFDLVVLIPLRCLTSDRYPPGSIYTPIDLLKKEHFVSHVLSEKEEKLLTIPFEKSKILWLLDGYDEIVGNIPAHLETLIEQLLKTTHHVLTSRPYAITLSYDVKMEIIGFTDTNIESYVKQFFGSAEGELENPMEQCEKLMTFLKQSSSIWGVAHIPVNLELICSLWCDTEWSETVVVTMAALYDKMAEWLCKRYVIKQDPKNKRLVKDEVYDYCSKELKFLETLAFEAMKQKNIILKPNFLRIVEKQSNWSLKDRPELLNIGILKSLSDKAISSDNDREKDHYFVHLSFQEYFAARYLANSLMRNACEDAVQFIKEHKYNQRFSLLFSFVAGILADVNDVKYLNIFWDTLQAEPIDLIGIRHMQLVILCLEETTTNKNFNQYSNLMTNIINCIKSSFVSKHSTTKNYVIDVLMRSPSIVNNDELLKVFCSLLQHQDFEIAYDVWSLICTLPIVNPQPDFVRFLVINLGRNKVYAKYACMVLGKMGDRVATKEIIEGIFMVFGHSDYTAKQNAVEALVQLSQKEAKTEIINVLISKLRDANQYSREHLLETLGKIVQRSANTEIIEKILSLINDVNINVRYAAYYMLSKMDTKAATNDIIKALIVGVMDTDSHVRKNACVAIGSICENIANNDVVKALLVGIQDTDINVRANACTALGTIGAKSVSSEIIKGLEAALSDANPMVSNHASKALAIIGKNSLNNDVIQALMSAIRNPDVSIRCFACEAFSVIGEKAANDEILKALVCMLGEGDEPLVKNACVALGTMGQKAANAEVITALLTAAQHQSFMLINDLPNAIVKINDKSPNTDVIAYVVTALGHSNNLVRRIACYTLEKIYRLDRIDRPVVRDDVINALVIALTDEDISVRRSACDALSQMGKEIQINRVINVLPVLLFQSDVSLIFSVHAFIQAMGEKAVCDEIINALIAVLESESNVMRQNACKTLDVMGERAAVDEVIKALLSVLDDKDERVRMAACCAVRKMIKINPKDEVIAALLTKFDDQNKSVRAYALEALSEAGEKAPIIKMIQGLRTVDSVEYSPSILHRIFDSLSRRSNLDANVLSDLVMACRTHGTYLKGISTSQLMRLYLDSRMTQWCSILAVHAICSGMAIFTIGNVLLLFDSDEPMRVEISDEIILNTLIKSFAQEKKYLNLIDSSSAETAIDSMTISTVCNIM